MPIVNAIRHCAVEKEYNLREGDVLIIGPCMLHELFCSGKRRADYFSAVSEQYFYQGAELAYYDYNPGYFDYTGGVSADL